MLAGNQHAVLKSYARKVGKTLGELVREAIDMVYQKRTALNKGDMWPLMHTRKVL